MRGNQSQGTREPHARPVCSSFSLDNLHRLGCPWLGSRPGPHRAREGRPFGEGLKRGVLHRGALRRLAGRERRRHAFGAGAGASGLSFPGGQASRCGAARRSAVLEGGGGPAHLASRIHWPRLRNERSQQAQPQDESVRARGGRTSLGPGAGLRPRARRRGSIGSGYVGGGTFPFPRLSLD